MEDKFTSDEILDYISKELQKDISSTRKLALYTQATEKHLDDGPSSLKIWLDYIKILQECEYDENDIREMFKILVKKFFCYYDFWEAFLNFEFTQNNHLKVADKYEKWIVVKSFEDREKILNLFSKMRKSKNDKISSAKKRNSISGKEKAVNNQSVKIPITNESGLCNIRTPLYTMSSRSDNFFVSNENKDDMKTLNRMKHSTHEKENIICNNNNKILSNNMSDLQNQKQDDKIKCRLNLNLLDNTVIVNPSYNIWNNTEKIVNDQIDQFKSNNFNNENVNIINDKSNFSKKNRSTKMIEIGTSPLVRKMRIDNEPIFKDFNENSVLESYRQNIRKPLISFKANCEVNTEEINKNVTHQMKKILNEEQKENVIPEIKCKGNEILFKNTVFTVIKQAGKGGGGVVFQVLHDSNIYALKKVKLPNERETILQGYLNEISILEKLKGFDEVIYLYDYEITDRYLLILMEYGETDLSTILRLNKKGIESVNYINYLWEQLLKAVHRIHQNRIIHRDLKPANFLLVQGKVKLIDFGIAKTIRNDTTNINIESQVGTINYMAPEAFDQERRKLGRSSDIWSLGCILYEMVYGYPPLDKFTNALHKIKNLQDSNYKIEYSVKSGKFSTIIANIKKCLIRDQIHRANIGDLLKSDLDSDEKILLGKKDLKALTKAVLNIKNGRNLNTNLVVNSIVEEFLRKIGK